MELYNRIRQRREELHMTQDELAQAMGYKSRSSINKIELGKSDIPQSKIKSFAEALKTTPEYLMGLEENTNKKNTAIRLKEIMEKRNLKQADILRLAKPYSEKYNIKLNKSDLSQYISGKNEPGQDKLFLLGIALNVNESWLMGFDVPQERYSAPNSQYLAEELTATNIIDCGKLSSDNNSKYSDRLMQYIPKLNKLTDNQKNIIYGMIDNMVPPKNNDVKVSLLAAHEDDDSSETDRQNDIEILKNHIKNNKQ